MFDLFNDLPVELVGTNVLGMLGIEYIVILERACGSKASHKHFMNIIPYSPAVVLPSEIRSNILTLEWFAKKRCKIFFLSVCLPGLNPVLEFKNIQIDHVSLHMDSNVTMTDCTNLIGNKLVCKVRHILINADQCYEVMKQLSGLIRNVESICIMSDTYNEWLTVDVLSNWKLKSINLYNSVVNEKFITLILQTCTEVTIIELESDKVDDAVVMAIAQYCPKLKQLYIWQKPSFTYNSLIVLSEQGLPIKELYIPYIPNISTADIARRCSHALSCIRHLYTDNLHQNGLDASTLIPYMTGLTRVSLNYYDATYIHLLAQHCHKLTKLAVGECSCSVEDILLLCRANPLLQELNFYRRCSITDTVLIELIHVCSHIHTLRLPNERNFTDIGILALSENCPQLQWLNVRISKQVTEAAVIQLLHRCHKLTRLEVSSSSLSEETWTQLDKNTQKRVIRCK